ncbi:hypothetical protein [Piscinibacter sp.]|uniref:hypothetical protein n=1 Tax=Piscinibacter sp. TaxID=1903157 RepID=UPI002C2CF0D0|nr:hypothetical protein [Albitalea sp.]HUG22350.1 hypothetical protein [Albitalea sp.]
MRIILLPETDIDRNEVSGPLAADDPARPVDRVAGPAYVVDLNVDVKPLTSGDELTASEWSAFAGLS